MSRQTQSGDGGGQVVCIAGQEIAINILQSWETIESRISILSVGYSLILTLSNVLSG